MATKNNSKKVQRAGRNSKKRVGTRSPNARDHRHGGGGQSQPRAITSSVRIAGVSSLLLTRASEYLSKVGIAVPEDSCRESYLKILVGLSDENFMISTFRERIESELGYKTLMELDMAFAYSYFATPDAALVPVESLPGVRLVDFETNLEICSIRDKAKGSRPVPRSATPTKSIASAEVARRVHAASQPS